MTDLKSMLPEELVGYREIVAEGAGMKPLGGRGKAIGAAVARRETGG